MSKCRNCGGQIVRAEGKEENMTWKTIFVCIGCGWEEEEARKFNREEVAFIKDDCWQ